MSIINKIIRFGFDYIDYKKKSQDGRFSIGSGNLKPMLFDNTTTTGFDRHYIYHPAWAARIISKTRPSCHVDISSTLHFCSIVSAFCKVDFYDYRPAKLELEGLSCKKGNLLCLPFRDNEVMSLSCMHTVEHIGLGRYGDNIDPLGDIKAMNELVRVLAINGNLLFVVPIGKKAIVNYNAHRIYTFEMIRDYFKELKLVEIVLIPEDGKDGGLVSNPSKELIDRQVYGCGCFWFKKEN